MASANFPAEPALQVPGGAGSTGPPPGPPTGPPPAGPTGLRKKPHMLPPLEKRRNSAVDYRAEVGSPTPKWRRPSLEEQLLLEEPPSDGRPAIRLTPAPSPPSRAALPPTVPGRYAPLQPIRRPPPDDPPGDPGPDPRP